MFLKMIKILLFAITFLIVCGFIKPDGNYNDTLRQVHVFFRHGSRRPALPALYPNDPNKDASFQPEGYGQLTNQGKQLAFSLGKRLRERYNDFLGPIYYPGIVTAKSTDYDRTKMSALLVLAGLFAPNGTQKWNEHLNWLPIPYQYVRYEDDNFLRMPQLFCLKYAEILENSIKIKAYLKSEEDTFRYVSENSGLKIETLTDMFDIFNTLLAEDWMGLELPQWTKSVYPQKMTNIVLKKFELETESTKMKRLSGGRLLQLVTNRIYQHLNYTLPLSHKLFLYSGHDYVVYNPLRAMNIANLKYPLYSWASVIELHFLKEKNQHFIKVLECEGPNAEPNILNIPDCDVGLCPLDKYFELMKDVIPQNYTEECNSKIDLDSKQFDDAADHNHNIKA